METKKLVKKDVKVDKIFIGKVQRVEFDNGGYVFNISFGTDDRKKLDDLKNSKGWNNLILKKSKDETKGFYIEVNTFVLKEN